MIFTRVVPIIPRTVLATIMIVIWWIVLYYIIFTLMMIFVIPPLILVRLFWGAVAVTVGSLLREVSRSRIIFLYWRLWIRVIMAHLFYMLLIIKKYKEEKQWVNYTNNIYIINISILNLEPIFNTFSIYIRILIICSLEKINNGIKARRNWKD